MAEAKSDPSDAKPLAELVPTDRRNHRQVAGDRALAEGIEILALAHQNLIWDPTAPTNGLRGWLRRAGRQRNLDARIRQIAAGLRADAFQALTRWSQRSRLRPFSQVAIVAEINE